MLIESDSYENPKEGITYISPPIKNQFGEQCTIETGKPHKLGFAFIGDEITKLYNFIRDVQVMRFGSEKFQRIADEDVELIAFSESQFQKQSVVTRNYL